VRTLSFLVLALAACGGTSSDPQPLAHDAAAAVEPGDMAESASDAATTPDALMATNATPDLAPVLDIVQSPIPFPDSRKQEMVTYSKNHYGDSTYALLPKQIILHFTATSTYADAWNIFASDAPNRDELPGTCAHYIVDQDGTIHQLVDESIRCRHAVGMDWATLGIEMVQETGTGATWADQQILQRPAQIDAVLKLVRVLQARYGITTDNVIGHATANLSPYFKDLEGWTNDHTDWQGADVDTVRGLLDKM
jgi:hypothetical protein